MKAYHLEHFGTIDGIVLGEDSVPEPRAGEAVMRVYARSVNYRDVLILHQQYLLSGSQGIIPLSDGAGEIVGVGAGVVHVAVGDRVTSTYFPRWRDGHIEPDQATDQFGCTRHGMLAEFVVAEEQAFVKIPSHLSYEEAATLPCAGVTAWSALHGPRRVLPGETVLTIGTGGVALFALQFARLCGAHTIAITSSDKKTRLLKELGADEVVDYHENPNWHLAVRALTDGRGIDHLVETGTVDTLPKSLSACAWNAQATLVLALTGGSLDVSALRGLVTVRRIFVGSRANFEAMNTAIAHHKLRPVIDRVFPFGEARAAYEHFAAKRHVGKVVIADARP